MLTQLKFCEWRDIKYSNTIMYSAPHDVYEQYYVES